MDDSFYADIYDDDFGLADEGVFDDYDLFKRRRFKWKKFVSKTKKNLGSVKKITDNPIARAVIGVIPFGGTALTALDTAYNVASAVDKGGLSGALKDPFVRAQMQDPAVPGGETLMQLLGQIRQDKLKQAATKITVESNKRGLQQAIVDEINEEMVKREFMIGRDPKSMKTHLAALKKIQSADHKDEDYYDEDYEDFEPLILT